ncbi:hypothetical protein APHAL10511_003406 [Amanita phalloides]|nr:hypothetical protein APHAL10511_003406 [Amanita phalloides]
MPPLPATFDQETTDLIEFTTRLHRDLIEVQLPRLRTCTGPLVQQQPYVTEIREDIDTLTRRVESLDLLVLDQKGEKNRKELRVIVDNFRDALVQLRQESRAALLASKKAIDSQSKSRRDELFKSSAVKEQTKTNEKVTDDALMKVHDDVTNALHRTVNLMQEELKRSVLSTQMLDASSTSLKSTSSAHDRLTDLMGTSKQLVKALEKADWLDRMLIISAFVFFLLVVLFIVQQRIIGRGLRIAFWWTRFLPDLTEKPPNAIPSGVVSSASILSSAVSSSLAAATISSSSASETPSSSLPPPMESSLLASVVSVDTTETASITVDTWSAQEARVELRSPKPTKSMSTPAASGSEESGEPSRIVGGRGQSIKRPRLDCPIQTKNTKDLKSSASKDVNEQRDSSPQASEKTTIPDSNPSLDTATGPIFPKVDVLASLPLELLGEVLVNTRSTNEVLQVARCSKHLWKTLTSPSATFIWKRTREFANPQPMPDPPSTLSERAYASMVFSTGKCEFCKSYTKEMYASFSLRLRICKRSCARAYPVHNTLYQMQKANIPDSQIWERIPTIERSLFSNPLDSAAIEYFKGLTLAYAKSQTTGNVEEFQRKNQEAIEKNKEWMEFCVALSKWRMAYKSGRSLNQQKNFRLCKEIAEVKRINVYNLLHDTSYGRLYDLRNRCFEELTWQDFKVMESKVESELQAVLERRKRSEREASKRTILKAIQKHHKMLRSQNRDLIVPPFPTFRRLPMFASLLAFAGAETSKSIQDILEKTGVEVVKAQTKKWEDDARRQMTAILGLPDFDQKSLSGEEVHPVDRYSAWFLCKHCTDRAVRYGNEIKPLRFRDACMHECRIPKGDKSRYRNKPWNASDFIKDEKERVTFPQKAIAVTKKHLELVGVNDSRKEPSSVSDSLWIICLSCQPYAQLMTGDMAAHCHRHEDMKIDIAQEVKKGEGSKAVRAAEDMMSQGADHYLYHTSGLAKKLIARTNRDRDLKDCGCRSCLLESMEKFKEDNLEELLAKQRKMTINGLRSHVKSKHEFEPIRDEDVFIFTT